VAPSNGKTDLLIAEAEGAEKLTAQAGYTGHRRHVEMA
jgi:hypothetical protein